MYRDQTEMEIYFDFFHNKIGILLCNREVIVKFSILWMKKWTK